MELLIVVAVIAILVGLLVPAVQIARESARRASCLSNLRQLAQATLRHADASKQLPGWRNTVGSYATARPAAEACLSWTVPLLPHVDQQTLYEQYAGYSSTTPAAGGPPPTRVQVFCCPSDGGARQGAPGRLSYAANVGSGAEVLDTSGVQATQFTGDGVLADAVGNLPSAATYDASRTAYAPAVVTLKKASADGAAETVLFTERAGVAAPQDVVWSDNPRAVRTGRGALVSNHGVLHPPPIGSGWRTDIRVINPTADTRPLPTPVPAGINVDDWPSRYPSSNHPGAVGMVFLDGHTQIVSERIDAWVYCQMLSSGGGAESPVAQDWQQAFDASGVLVPYVFKASDLVK